jgi:hypothetical protein
VYGWSEGRAKRLGVVTPKMWTMMKLPYTRSKGGRYKTPRRQFTAAFNVDVVLELLSGAKSCAELGREPQRASSVLADGKASFLAPAAAPCRSAGPARAAGSGAHRGVSARG